MKIPCPYCNGAQAQHAEFCHLCHGEGVVVSTDDFRERQISIHELHPGNRFRLMAGLSLLPEIKD